MQSEKVNCQNCKKDFVIESEDFNFYEKIKVPPPTFCRSVDSREDMLGEMSVLCTGGIVICVEKVQ